MDRWIRGKPGRTWLSLLEGRSKFDLVTVAWLPGYASLIDMAATTIKQINPSTYS